MIENVKYCKEKEWVKEDEEWEAVQNVSCNINQATHSKPHSKAEI